MTYTLPCVMSYILCVNFTCVLYRSFLIRLTDHHGQKLVLYLDSTFNPMSCADVYLLLIDWWDLEIQRVSENNHAKSVFSNAPSKQLWAESPNLLLFHEVWAFVPVSPQMLSRTWDMPTPPPYTNNAESQRGAPKLKWAKPPWQIITWLSKSPGTF